MHAIAHPGRVGVAVADAVVDRLHPRCIEISQIAHLQRRRLARKQQQAVAPGVPGNIDENVYPVGTNQLRRARIVHTGDSVPVLRMPHQSPRYLVHGSAAVIAKHLECFALMPRQHRFDEMTQRMLAEISRHVADAQAPLRVGRIAMNLGLREQRVGVNIRPGEMFRVDLVRPRPRQQRQDIQQVGTRGTRARGERQGVSKNRGRLLGASAVHQNAAEIVEEHRIAGTRPDGTLEILCGRIQIAQAVCRQPQQMQRIRLLRLPFEHLFAAQPRSGQIVGIKEDARFGQQLLWRARRRRLARTAPEVTQQRLEQSAHRTQSNPRGGSRR